MAFLHPEKVSHFILAEKRVRRFFFFLSFFPRLESGLVGGPFRTLPAIIFADAFWLLRVMAQPDVSEWVPPVWVGGENCHDLIVTNNISSSSCWGQLTSRQHIRQVHDAIRILISNQTKHSGRANVTEHSSNSKSRGRGYRRKAEPFPWTSCYRITDKSCIVERRRKWKKRLYTSNSMHVI